MGDAGLQLVEAHECVEVGVGWDYLRDDKNI
jgi:hypothetical protein